MLNGVVLVSYINEVVGARDAHLPRVGPGGRATAPAAGGADRHHHRALGLVPFLFATGGRCAEIQRPLAIVVIGGLFTATLLTLVLLPILYERFGCAAAEKGAHDARLAVDTTDMATPPRRHRRRGLGSNLSGSEVETTHGTGAGAPTVSREVATHDKG